MYSGYILRKDVTSSTDQSLYFSLLRIILSTLVEIDHRQSALVLMYLHECIYLCILADIFLVNMVNNPAAEKCKLVGAYEFHISTENFALVDKRSKKRLYTWPFRYVRRYGKSSTNFQFEAGRKTQSGLYRK